MSVGLSWYPVSMKTSIQFEISLEDGVYTASGINAPIVTEAATFEELKENIRDAMAAYLFEPPSEKFPA